VGGGNAGGPSRNQSISPKGEDHEGGNREFDEKQVYRKVSSLYQKKKKKGVRQFRRLSTSLLLETAPAIDSNGKRPL